VFGAMLAFLVIVAPSGLMGLFARWTGTRRETAEPSR